MTFKKSRIHSKTSGEKILKKTSHQKMECKNKISEIEERLRQIRVEKRAVKEKQDRFQKTKIFSAGGGLIRKDWSLLRLRDEEFDLKKERFDLELPMMTNEKIMKKFTMFRQKQLARNPQKFLTKIQEHEFIMLVQEFKRRELPFPRVD